MVMDIGMNIFGVKPTETPLFVPKFPIPKNEKEFQNLLKDVVHWQELGEKEWIQDADEALAGYLSSPNTATSADLDLLIGLPLPKTHVALQPLLTKTLGIPLSSEATSCLDRLDDERQLLTQNPLSEEEEAQFSTALDDLKGTLATFRPSELFRLLQYVRTKSQHRSFVKPIFLKLCDYASRGELEEKRAKFLLKLAHQNGGLFAALGKGEDAWVVRMREEGTGKVKEYSCSRFLLVYSSDYFAALNAAIIQDKESEQEGVFDLSASSLKIEDFEMFYNWLALRQFPLPKADEEKEYLLKLQRLATFLTKAAFKKVEAHLQQEISVQALASFVYVALKLNMPNLLKSCIDFIEIHYPTHVSFERLNHCSLTIHYKTAQVPEEIRKALSLLVEKQKGVILSASVSRLGYLKNLAQRTISFLKDPCGLASATDRAMQEAFSGEIVPKTPSLPKQSNSFFLALESYRKGAEKTRTLDLSQCPDLEDEHLQYLVEVCPHLTALKLGVNPKLTAEGYDSLKHLKQLCFLHLAFPQERFQLGSLNHLNISFLFGTRPHFKLTLEVPALRSHLPAFPTPSFFQNIGPEIAVEVIMERHYEPQGLLDPVALQGIDYLTRWCPTVTSLKLDLVDLSQEDCTFMAQRWRHLRELQIATRWMGSSELNLLALLKSPSLQVLSLLLQREDEVLTPRVIESLVTHCPHLTDLQMMGCRNLTNQSLQLLGTLPELRKILIFYNTQITDEGVEALLDVSIPPLQVHLYYTLAVSPSVLARAFKTIDPETGTKAKLASLLIQQTFPKQFQLKGVQPHAQKLFSLFFDVFIENKLFLDFPWPLDLELEHLTELIAQFKEEVRAKLHLPTPPATPKINISFAHYKAYLNSKKKFKATPALIQDTVTKCIKTLEHVLRYTPFTAIVDSRSKEAFFMRKILPILPTLMTQLAQSLPEFELNTYYEYLKARPQLNLDKVVALHKELEKSLRHLIEQESEQLNHFGMALAHFSVREVSFQGLNEERWKLMFKTFLGNIQKVGQQEKWSDQSKCAVLLGGVLIFVTEMRKALFPKEEELLLSEDERLSALEGKREA